MPFLGGNDARLLIDGEATFAAILSAIDAAQVYVVLEFYIVRDDGLGQALKACLLKCLRREVKVYFLYDGIGSHALSQAFIRELRAAGAELVPFLSSRNPLRRLQVNFRNHRKIVVVDGHTAFVGGHNVGDEYLGKHPRLTPWRDTHVEVRGPAAAATQLVFLEDWYWATHTVPTLSWDPSIVHPRGLRVLAAATGPADELESCALLFTQAIAAARRRVWITSPYFVPDEAVMRALQLAALRGVDVRIMLPGKADHLLVHLAGLSYIPEAWSAGIRLVRYRNGFLHQKVMVADDISAIGTANLDNRSLRLNFEITMMFADAAFADAVAGMLAHDFAVCEAVSERTLGDFPVHLRVAARAARLFAPVL